MKAKQRAKAYLLLADGMFFEGVSIGSKGTSGGEICFNTGMSGYQEIYTDPSYFGQIVVNTTPHIGNYGAIDTEQESDKPKINGLVVSSYAEVQSRHDADETLDEYLKKHGVVGIADLDTRRLVKHLRDKGAMNAIISTDLDSSESLNTALNEVPSMDNLELSSKVTVQAPYILNDGGQYKVAVLDLGVKKSILTNLVDRNCELKVFPAKTSFAELKNYSPDAYFLSNGPGDPSAMSYAVDTAKKIIEEKAPVFGICLGHQILALASGLTTFKMHHGHRGLNHPVKNLVTGLSEITSQNHGFAVDRASVEQSEHVELTHVNLNDHTCAGIRLKNAPSFSVQHHPEASPGPHDSRYLFDDFLQLIINNRK